MWFQVKSVKIGARWNNMIYFVTGDDRQKVLKTSQGLVAALQKKRPGALVFRISADDWSRNSFDGIAGGQGLFENKYIVVLESLFQNEEAAEYFGDSERMKELKVADHAFVFVEYSPKAPVKNAIKKHAEKVWDTSEQAGPKSAGRVEFNIFALTDALGERNRSRLWVLYQRALMQGSEPEEIHGILFWKIKSLLAAAQSKTATDAGLKPFVWSKSQGFLKKYSLAELKKMSSDMVGLYHLSRIESLELEDELEKFLLRV